MVTGFRLLFSDSLTESIKMADEPLTLQAMLEKYQLYNPEANVRLWVEENIPTRIPELDELRENHRALIIKCIALAIQRNEISVVKCILSGMTAQQKRELLTWSDADFRVLHAAAASPNAKIIKCMLDSMSVEQRCELLQLRGGCDRTPVHCAAEQGSESSIVHMLEGMTSNQMFNILKVQDTRDETALHLAASRNNAVEVITALLKLDIMTAHKYQLLIITRKDGNTAIHQAARRKQTTTVRHMLEGLGDVNIFDLLKMKNTFSGETAVHYAAEKDGTEFIACLLDPLPPQKICDLLKVTKNFGETAVHCAVAEGYTRTVRALLKSLPQEDVYNILKIPNEAGKTAIHLAQQKEDDEIFMNNLLSYVTEEQRTALLDIQNSKQLSLTDIGIKYDKTKVTESRETQDIGIHYDETKVRESRGIQETTGFQVEKDREQQKHDKQQQKLQQLDVDLPGSSEVQVQVQAKQQSSKRSQTLVNMAIELQPFRAIWATDSFNDSATRDAQFHELAKKLSIDFATAKTHYKSLRTKYRKEWNMVEDSRRSGAVGSHVYVPRWKPYQFLSYLEPTLRMRKGKKITSTESETAGTSECGKNSISVDAISATFCTMKIQDEEDEEDDDDEDDDEDEDDDDDGHRSAALIDPCSMFKADRDASGNSADESSRGVADRDAIENVAADTDASDDDSDENDTATSDEDDSPDNLKSAVLDPNYKQMPQELINVITTLCIKNQKKMNSVSIHQDGKDWKAILVMGVNVKSIEGKLCSGIAQYDSDYHVTTEDIEGPFPFKPLGCIKMYREDSDPQRPDTAACGLLVVGDNKSRKSRMGNRPAHKVFAVTAGHLIFDNDQTKMLVNDERSICEIRLEVQENSERYRCEAKFSSQHVYGLKPPILLNFRRLSNDEPKCESGHKWCNDGHCPHKFMSDISMHCMNVDKAAELKTDQKLSSMVLERIYRLRNERQLDLLDGRPIQVKGLSGSIANSRTKLPQYGHFLAFQLDKG